MKIIYTKYEKEGGRLFTDFTSDPNGNLHALWAHETTHQAIPKNHDRKKVYCLNIPDDDNPITLEKALNLVCGIYK